MTLSPPKSYLSPDDCLLLDLTEERLPDGVLTACKRLDIKVRTVTPTPSAPWLETNIVDLLNPPKSRQLILLTETIGAFETGMTLMCLEIGFEVFLSIPSDTQDEMKTARLRQASAIILSHQTLTAELGILLGT